MKLNRLNSVSIANTFASILPQDSLNEFMKCLAPLASNLEKNIIDNKLNDIDDTLKDNSSTAFGITAFRTTCLQLVKVQKRGEKD